MLLDFYLQRICLSLYSTQKNSFSHLLLHRFGFVAPPLVEESFFLIPRRKTLYLFVFLLVQGEELCLWITGRTMLCRSHCDVSRDTRRSEYRFCMKAVHSLHQSYGSSCTIPLTKKLGHTFLKEDLSTRIGCRTLIPHPPDTGTARFFSFCGREDWETLPS